jgi:outer membrane protein assembly factor BamB/cytochrome c2
MRARIQFLVLAAATVGAAAILVAQQPADAVRNPLGTDPDAITAGRQLYDQTCQSCHGPAGQGERGPALSAAKLSHGGDDGELFHTIRAGIQGTQMPAFPRLTDTQTWRLVSYIRDLQGSPGVSASAGGSVPGNPAAGEAVFLGVGGCANCHEVNGRGGVVGPDLSGAGRQSAAALRQKIVDPNNPLAAPPAAGRGGGGGGGGGPRGGSNSPTTIIVKTQDGREIRGVRRNEDTFSLQLVDQTGRLQLFDKAKVASMTEENRSLMSADYATRLSPADITNLIAFLHDQQGRDSSKTSTQPQVSGGVAADRLRNSKAEPQNWLMYWGDYQGTRSSPLNQITTANVGKLQSVWATPVPGTNALETTPVVVDGVMYVTAGGDPLTVMALDARTGRQIWRYTRPQKTKNPYANNPHNRGVSVLGNRLYTGTLDAALVSLDARTGLVMWEAQLGDTMEGYSITSPPLIVGNKVITGISGGEYATRGSIQAFDAASGKHLWTFFTIPGPGEFGNDTWKGDSWKTGGGATWLTGTYDPELNTLYWPVGNPAAQIDRSVRGDLDNLFSDSVVALDPETGRRKWHYQFTPNDGHDWDSTEDMMLVDRMWRGQNCKLLLHADRNGYFYVLDRTSGAFLGAWPFVYQNWNKGFDDRVAVGSQ